MPAFAMGAIQDSRRWLASKMELEGWQALVHLLYSRGRRSLFVMGLF